jgi:hypothetical protein
MRAPRHVGTIHGYATNKRTPALLTSQTSPLEIAITRQSLPRSQLEYCSAARLRLGCTKRRTPLSGPQFLPTASQLAATQRAPPGVQPAARPDKKKNARSPFSGPQFLPTCYESYVVVAVNTDIPQVLHIPPEPKFCPIQSYLLKQVFQTNSVLISPVLSF